MIISPAQRVQTVEEYYFSIKLKQIAQMRNLGVDIINLGIGSPDLPPDPVVVHEMNKYLAREDLHGYQSYIGRPELRSSFSKWYLQYYGIKLDAEAEVLPLTGSKEGIMHIHMAFINPGDVVLIPNPGYPTYAASAKLAGANIKYYDLTAENNWQPNWSQLNDLDWSSIKIMWINYPHMPTGALPAQGTFERLIALAKENHFLLCHDNPYSFILNEHPVSILSVSGSRNVAVELNSLSKSHNMAGWRLGCVVGHEDYLRQILKFKSNMDSGVLAATQLAAVKALDLPKSWYEELNVIYEERRTVARQIFDFLEINYEEDPAGMFLWGEIPSRWNSAFELSDYLLNECAVFITPGGIFGSNGDQYLRISLCSKTELLEQALSRLHSINIKEEAD